jgi:CheY-like chemotaxis protein
MDAERLLTRLIGETIEMKVTVAPTRALIRADPSHIEQVIINLVTNARDAMPRGGALTITTSLVEADGAATSAAGSYVVLSVGDTGVGMDPETQRRAFDPFFTTKGVGEGSGLGLATVYGIVEQSGGRISVDSKPGEGSRFDIYLPRATESDLAATDDEIAAVPGESTVGATILIAEDEPEVRSVIGRMLRLAGFDVLLAADGKEAQARARAYQGPIDLLVTDVVMAPVGGLELARELCAERPRLRVLFVTGYTFEHDLPPADPARGIDHLHKPLTFEKLIKKVALLLAGPGHGTGARAALGSGRHRSERG